MTVYVRGRRKKKAKKGEESDIPEGWCLFSPFFSPPKNHSLVRYNVSRSRRVKEDDVVRVLRGRQDAPKNAFTAMATSPFVDSKKNLALSSVQPVIPHTSAILPSILLKLFFFYIA